MVPAVVAVDLPNMVSLLPPQQIKLSKNRENIAQLRPVAKTVALIVLGRTECRLVSAHCPDATT